MIDYEDVLEAADRVEGVARRTPLTPSQAFSDLTGADVRLKLENNQRTGAFKIRGATNRIETLSDAQRAAGVVTASAGNHAQGVALAASRLGVDATIVMPEQAAVSKVEATEAYGAEVVLHGSDYNEAAARAHELEAEAGLTYVHAFDDEYVMAGQGTLGLELLEDCPELDTVIVPIGGGGLISGIATAIKGAKPDARVIGVEAEGADSAFRSLEAGHIVELDAVDTIADGLAARRVGDRTFEVISERVDEVVRVSDSETAVAVMLALERAKTLVEGAGAVPLAALLSGAVEVEPDEVVVPVLSGGNIDMNMLTTVLMRGLVETGRYLKIRTVLPDRPGALVELSSIIAEQKANIYAFQHDRTSRDVGLNDAEVEVDIEARGPEHVESLLADLREHGYEVEVLQ
ncbi:MAG: threonine ammonia-lyase [Halobacteriales archaeon]|nr:threonine ammonia-lyase [Halobacteriales archaeon]